MSLRSHLIRLAFHQPDLRSHLLTIITASEEAQKGSPPKWNEYLKSKWEGGKKKVPNSNPKTKESHPSVSMSTKMKNDSGFQKQVMDDYKKWMESSKEEPPKSEPKNRPQAIDIHERETYGDSWNPIRETWTDEQIEGLIHYTGSNYRSINEGLRQGKKMSKADRSALTALDSLFEKASISEDVLVARGISEGHPFAEMLQMGTLEIGTEMEDGGYTSTTITSVENWRWGDTSMSIHVPKGAKGVYLGPPPYKAIYSKNTNEREILLNRGTKLRITGIDKKKNIIHAEVVLD